MLSGSGGVRRRVRAHPARRGWSRRSGRQGMRRLRRTPLPRIWKPRMRWGPKPCAIDMVRDCSPDWYYCESQYWRLDGASNSPHIHRPCATPRQLTSYCGPLSLMRRRPRACRAIGSCMTRCGARSCRNSSRPARACRRRASLLATWSYRATRCCRHSRRCWPKAIWCRAQAAGRLLHTLQLGRWRAAVDGHPTVHVAPAPAPAPVCRFGTALVSCRNAERAWLASAAGSG